MLAVLIAAVTLAGAVPAGAAQQAAPPVDPYAPYEPQDACDPTPKPGVVAFAKLLLEAYPLSGWSGISRDCAVGGRSEHKEGRAFDWAVSVSNPQQRAVAEDALARLLGTDEDGNRHALFRRFGLMYVIWNRQIFSATQADAGWRPYACSSAASYDDCHVNHVHFSFSTAGAGMRTSWWTMAPEPAPPASVVDRIVAPTPARVAIEISAGAFPSAGSAEQVYIAHADERHDAMIASVMAGASHGAVLLTRGRKALEARVDTELRRLVGDQRATLTFVGDTATLPDELLDAYRDGHEVRRVAGADAFGTARAAALDMEQTGQQRTAVVVGASALDEALPMVAVAAANDWPVIFTGRDELHADARRFLLEAGVTQVHLAGSTRAIARSVRRQIAELEGMRVTRHGGQDPEGISVAVADSFFAIPSGYAVARQDDPVTAAVAAAYAGERRHAPLLLTDGAALRAETTDYIIRTSSPDSVGLVFGAADAVQPRVERQLRRALR